MGLSADDPRPQLKVAGAHDAGFPAGLDDDGGPQQQPVPQAGGPALAAGAEPPLKDGGGFQKPQVPPPRPACPHPGLEPGDRQLRPEETLPPAPSPPRRLQGDRGVPTAVELGHHRLELVMGGLVLGQHRQRLPRFPQTVPRLLPPRVRLQQQRRPPQRLVPPALAPASGEGLDSGGRRLSSGCFFHGPHASAS